jgi:hypothetical protein
MVNVTITWHPAKREGFVSAWDAARSDYGCIAFDQLTRWEQIAAVRQYVGREVSA